jgi:hypothetical protein
VKPIAEFPVEQRRGGGVASECSDCKNGRQSKRRKDVPGLSKTHAAAARLRHPETWRIRNALRSELFPKSRYAIGVIKNEIKRGRLQVCPCEVCGATEHVHGHHDDYDKPLVVRWLCPVHHADWHVANGPGANIEGPVV